MKKKILIIVELIAILGVTLFALTGCENNKEVSEQNDNGKTSEKTEEVYSIRDNDIYYVTINGKKFKAGEKISSVSKVDLKQKDKNLEEEIPTNRYLMAQSVINSDEEEVCKFVPLNSTDSKITVKDAVIGGFEVGDNNYEKLSEATLALNIEVVGGLKLGSSYEDMVKVLGEENFKTEIEADEQFKMPAYTVYKYSSGYKGYDFTIDDSGKISEIKWRDYNYDE